MLTLVILFSRYYCVIENVMGKNECTAYLSIRSSAPPGASSLTKTMLLISVLLAATTTTLLWTAKT